MKKLLTFVAITAVSLTICAQPKLTPSNIDDVVKALTLQEKASLLVGYTMGQSYFGLPSAPDPNAKEIVPGAAGNTCRSGHAQVACGQYSPWAPETR